MVDIGYSRWKQRALSVPLDSWTHIYTEHRTLAYENIESILLNAQNRLSPKTNRIIYSVIAEIWAIIDSFDTIKQYIIDTYSQETQEQTFLPLIQDAEWTQVSPQEKLKSRFQKLWQTVNERRDQAEKIHAANANNPKPEFEPLGRLIKRWWSVFKQVVKRDLFLKRSN